MSAEMQPPKMTASTLPAPDTDRDADVADHKTAGLLDYLGFPPSRRMKRLTFCTAFLGLNSILILLYFFWVFFFFSWNSSDVVLPTVGFYIALFAVNIRLAIQRCRDIGWTSWWVLLLLVPLANVIFLMYLSIWSSETEEAAPRGSWWTLAASMLPMAFLLSLYF